MGKVRRGVVVEGEGVAERETVKSEDRRRKSIVLRREGRGGEEVVLFVREEEGRFERSHVGEMGRECEDKIEEVICAGMSLAGVEVE